jgi:hypothetical protein
MSQTTIQPHPADILLHLIAALLAPMFLCVTAGDVDLARMGAIETINAYRARDHADLIAVAQIIGNGLAALASLSQSMEDDISLSMVLRLRGNAIALNRVAEQNRRAIRQNRGETPTPTPIPHPIATPQDPEIWYPAAEPEPEFETFLTPDAAKFLAAESESRLRNPLPIIDHNESEPTPAPGDQRSRAVAMIKEALKIEVGIAALPPEDRRLASIRIAELNTSANQLLSGAGPPAPRH